MNDTKRSSTRSPLVIAFSFIVIIACLYLAQAVLIPVALALLLSFLLAPVVNGLEWVGLGRVLSVVLVVVLTFVVLAGIGWTVTSQVTTLAAELPNYESNIKRKIGDLRNLTKGGTLEQVQKTVEEIKEEIQKTEEPKKKEQPPRREVVVERDRSFTFLPAPVVVGPLFERLASAGLVVILVVFMLIRREDMRNRLIRFTGRGRMTMTTKALEDAGERISRYLLIQGIINSVYGIGVGLGLYLVGVPYAVLWGFFRRCFALHPIRRPVGRSDRAERSQPRGFRRLDLAACGSGLLCSDRALYQHGFGDIALG